MRRKRAIWLGVVLAGVLAYLAWWGRQFYLRPELLIDHAIPPEAEEVIRKWHEESGAIPPVRLTLGKIMDSIHSPSGAEDGGAIAILESETEVRVFHDGREWFFRRTADGWALDPAAP